MNGKFAAIKLPKNNCDKELFKTFLDELKVMAYIKNLGGHQNIVNLIGAYTGEIRKRKISLCYISYIKNAIRM